MYTSTVTMSVPLNFTTEEQQNNVTIGGGVDPHDNQTAPMAVPATNVMHVSVAHFCASYPQLSLVVTIPLLFVVASVLGANVLLIINSCRNQQPNHKPVQLPTVCFASGSVLNGLILVYLQLYVALNKEYSCGVVHIIEQFQVLVLAFFCLHLLVAAIRFCLLMCRPSFDLRDSVPSPHVRTTVVLIWFQATSHCLCVLLNLFIFKHMPDSLNLVIFCLVLTVPLLTVVLFVLSQAARYYRRMRRHQEWTGGAFPYSSMNKECVVFKWALMTACTLLLFWLPFWTKNVYDYLTDQTALLSAFSFYTWVIVDILLLSNSLLIHLI